MIHHVRHLAELRQLSGLPRLKRRRLPRQIYPRMVERDYAEEISRLVLLAVRRSLEPLTAALPRLLETARQARGDEDYHRRFAGFRVVVENPVGSTRYWSTPDRAGETVMRYAYGYIEGAIGADGDEVDVYLGPDERAQWVYVVHQLRAPGFETYDEDKVMLGFASLADAERAYLVQYDDPRFFGGMTALPVEDFRRQLRTRDGGTPIAYRADADENKWAQRLVDEARKRLGEKVDAAGLEKLAVKYAKQTSQHSKRELAKQTKAAIGVDVAAPDKGLTAMIDHFVAENVALISSLGRNQLDKVEQLVTRAVSSGTLHGELAQQIQERFDVGENHAKLIARDQIGKLYGQVNAARQKELGVKRFIWRTVNDARVRDEHTALEQQSLVEPFLYSDPPNGELPGEPIQCRCVAEPVFGEIKDAIDFEED